ncbi:MAG: hypothetical protein BGO27_03575 [Alphaproteobacteria bacterium 33-17]|nr:MAG: hypothetical protein BGO27_03575 [Alphaproteobacteria bacterium 33-17]
MIYQSRNDIKYQTVFINRYLDAITTFDHVININFEVDEIVLKNLVVVDLDANNSPNLVTIKSNLVEDQILYTYPIEINNIETTGGVVSKSFQKDLNIPFQVKKGMGNINSTYTFTFLNNFIDKTGAITNASLPATNKIYISMCLVFIKYLL